MPFLGQSQIDFYKIFTNNGYDFGQGIVQLEDSSYVITGTSSSFVEGASQAFLLKIDSLGNYIWSTNYGGVESDGGRRVLYKKNVGFYIAGFTNSIGEGGYDFYLVKTDEQGNFQWQKSYGGDGWEKVNDAIMLSDGGIMMVGQSNTGTAGNNNIFIVRTDLDGTLLWTKNIGDSGDDFATSIRSLNDSICIVGGQKYIEDSLMNKAYLMSIHINGNIQWEKYYGKKGEYKINDLCIVGTKINVVGNHIVPVTNDVDGYTAKLTTTGVLNYEFAFPTSGYDSYDLVTPYSQLDKLYITYSKEMLGETYPIGKDLYFSRFTESLIWDDNFFGINNSGDDIGGQIISTSDGGAIIVGYNTSFGAGGNNVFVAKIGENDVFPITTGAPVSNNLVQIYENQIENTDKISIYPNPASIEIYIDLPEDFKGEIVIKDITGKLVLTGRDLSVQKLYKMNIENLEKGNYFVSIISDKKQVITKMITIQTRHY